MNTAGVRVEDDVPIPGHNMPRRVYLRVANRGPVELLAARLRGLGVEQVTVAEWPTEATPRGEDASESCRSVSAVDCDLVMVDAGVWEASFGEAFAATPVLVIGDATTLGGQGYPVLSGLDASDDELRDAMWFAMVWHQLADLQMPLLQLFCREPSWIRTIDETLGAADVRLLRDRWPWTFDGPEPAAGLLATVHPEDRERVQRNYARQFQEGSQGQIRQEYRLITRDGQVAWVQERLLHLPAEEGKPRRLLSVATDVTARRAERRRFSETAGMDLSDKDDMPVGIEEYDLHGRLVYVNSKACAILGRQERRILGCCPSAFAAWEEAAAELDAALAACVAPSGTPFDSPTGVDGSCVITTPSLHQDGRLVQVQRALRPTVNAAGEVVGCNSVVSDVTNLIRREQELRDSARLNQQLLDSLPFGALLITSEGRVLASNRLAGKHLQPPPCWQGEHPETALKVGYPLPRCEMDECCMQDSRSCPSRAAAEAIELQRHVQQVIHSNGKVWDMHWIPMDDQTVLQMGIDNTENAQRDANFHALVNSICVPVGQTYFEHLVKALAEWLGVDGAMVTEVVDDVATAVAFYWQGSYYEDCKYYLADTPCATVMEQGPLIISEGASKMYPLDTELTKRGIECYVGEPVRETPDSPTIGMLCAMGSNPLVPPPQVEEVFRVLAARTASELQRRQTEQALMRATLELESRVQSRTREIFSINKKLQHYCQVEATVAEVLLLTHKDMSLERMMEMALGDLVTLPGLVDESTHGAIFLMAGDGLKPEPTAQFPIHTAIVQEKELDAAVLFRSERPEARQTSRGWRYVIPIWADHQPRGLAIILRERSDPPKGEDLAAITVVARAIGQVLQRALTEDALRDMQQAMRRSEKLATLGKLAGGISHDFNNHLTTILGYGQELLRVSRESAPARDAAVHIVDAAQHLARLASKLSAFNPRSASSIATFDLAEVIESTLATSQLRDSMGIEVLSSIPCTSIRVYGERSHLQHAIWNVVQNALEAMPGGGRLSLELSVETAERLGGVMHMSTEAVDATYALLRIADTGCGIAADRMEHIFDPGYSTKSQIGSSGLGLCAAQRIVDEHLGIIDIRSEVGIGTTALIAIPLSPESAPLEAPVAPPAPPAPPADTPAAAKASAARSAHILVVEDRDMVRRVVVDALKFEGHQVASFSSSVDALAYFTEHWATIDVLILDLIMPDMNGFELFKHVRLIDSQSNIVIASGYSDRDGRIRALLDAGGCLFLQKPFSPDELLLTVERALQSPRQQIESPPQT